MTQFARVWIDLGDLESAERCRSRAAESAKRVQDLAGSSRWYACRAYLHIAHGRLHEAAESARKDLELRIEIGDPLGIAEAAECLALLAVRSETGDPAWLLAAAQRVRTVHRLPAAWASRPIQDTVRAHLRDRNQVLPHFEMDSVTPQSLLQHARRIVAEAPGD